MPVEPVAMIEVQYRFIDGYHVFTSEDVYGLYVASENPEKAFGNVTASIKKLIKLNDGIDIDMSPAKTYREFLNVLTGEPVVSYPAIINESCKFLLHVAA